MHGSREQDFKRNNAFSLPDLYGHELGKQALPRGHEFKIWVDPSLVIITIY